MKKNYSEMSNGYLKTIQNGIAGVRTFRSGISRGTGTRQENLDLLKNDTFFISYAPLPIVGLDSCPVRAYAIEGLAEFSK